MFAAEFAPIDIDPTPPMNAYFEPALEMLGTIADVLDIGAIVPRLSAVARTLLPHDALAFAFVGADGEVVTATSTDEFPTFRPVEAEVRRRGVAISQDLNTDPLLRTMDDMRRARLLAAGYRSQLSVNTHVRDYDTSVVFWSKRPHAFGESHVPLARWIAEHVAVAVSHQQMVRSATKLTEDRGRTRLDVRLRAIPDALHSKAHGSVAGESSEWQAVERKAVQVAGTDTTVLVCGESGTGKEVVARMIHRASSRKDAPFIALNCAALPEQLLESELFGYERGAFTGAQQSKPGHIELAAGGVLFLDEVSEMSLTAQAKFLRVLQEREFHRLGGTRPIRVDFRLIAATNRDLALAVERGTFREDLYYRLQVFDIQIAPLRERRADILPLCEIFLQEIARPTGRPPASLTPAARQALLQHQWPGNVRELHNALERAIVFSEGGPITESHLALRPVGKRLGSTGTDLRSMERETVVEALRDCNWNKSKAARRLGLSRTQLDVRVRRYELERPATV